MNRDFDRIFRDMDNFFDNDPFFGGAGNRQRQGGGRSIPISGGVGGYRGAPISNGPSIEEVHDSVPTGPQQGRVRVEEPDDEPAPEPQRMHRDREDSRRDRERRERGAGAAGSNRGPAPHELMMGGGFGGPSDMLGFPSMFGNGGFGGFGMGMGGDLFGNMFNEMNAMMESTQRMMNQAVQSGNAYTYSYSSSSVMGPDGRHYVRTEQSQQAPGGVREVRKLERDPRTGQERVVEKRVIGDRARIVERTHDLETGRELHTNERLKGVNSAAEFDSQWQQESARLPYRRGDQAQGQLGGGSGGGAGRYALPDGRSTKY